MRLPEVVRYEQRLDNLFAKLPDEFVDSDLLQQHWPRYLCVLTSGYVEVAVRAILIHYVEQKSAPTVAHFAQKRLERFQNPDMPKIYEIVGAFSSDWEAALRELDEADTAAVTSIVANRHLIAHGRDTGISYNTIRNYYQQAKKVVAALEVICAP